MAFAFQAHQRIDPLCFRQGELTFHGKLVAAYAADLVATRIDGGVAGGASVLGAFHSEAGEQAGADHGDGHRLFLYEVQPLNIEFHRAHHFNGRKDAAAAPKLHYKCERDFEPAEIYSRRL